MTDHDHRKPGHRLFAPLIAALMVLGVGMFAAPSNAATPLCISNVSPSAPRKVAVGTSSSPAYNLYGRAYISSSALAGCRARQADVRVCLTEHRSPDGAWIETAGSCRTYPWESMANMAPGTYEGARIYVACNTYRWTYREAKSVAKQVPASTYRTGTSTYFC